MSRTLKFCLPLIVLALSPTVAYADAGTPLMWAGMFHLLIGNAIIGIGEGLILARFFRPKRAGCIPIMIAANYFSAWVGGVFLSSAIVGWLDLDLYNARRWLWCMVVVTYLLTLLLEWPFVALCFRKTDGWFRKSLWGSLVVQSASYLILFGWYWAASGTSLYTDLAVVQPSAITLPKETTLYYLSENNTDIYAWELGEGKPKKISDFTSTYHRNALFLDKSRTAGRWDLMVGPEYASDASDAIYKTVAAGLPCDIAEPVRARLAPGGEVPRFRADKSGWQFSFGWMAGRLDGENAKAGKNLGLSLETPFAVWLVSFPTQLPSGQVVFQLGRNQICVLDPNERKVALIAKGRSPVITMNLLATAGLVPAER
jgi:hypothetical protein